MVTVLFVKLHLLDSLLKWCMYVARDSFFFCCISIKQDMEVCISELHIFNCNTSLISSQDLPDGITSVIKVHVSVCIVFNHFSKGFSVCWQFEQYRQSLQFSSMQFKAFEGYPSSA